MEDLSTLFPALRGEVLSDFEKVAERMTFSRGEQLYEQGFPCPFVPFIAKGVVRVFKIGESGREITLYRVPPGQVCVLSSTCSISNKQYPAIAEAEEDTIIYVVPGNAFRNLLKTHPPLHELLFDVMSERLIEMMQVVDEVAFCRVDIRLAKHLLDQTIPPKAPVISATHAQIAVELGSAREVISRILKDFERQGMVALVRGRVEVLSRDRLSGWRDTMQMGAA